MKILLPIDGSPCATQTLTWAAGFLDKVQAEIYLLCVAHYIPTTPEVAYIGYEYEIEATQEVLKKAQTQLFQAGFNTVKTDYRVGGAAEEICKYANEQNIDQIILGSHGRTGLANMLFGSVSHDVFKYAKQPVLVYNNSEAPSLEISHLDQINLSLSSSLS